VDTEKSKISLVLSIPGGRAAGAGDDSECTENSWSSLIVHGRFPGAHRELGEFSEIRRDMRRDMPREMRRSAGFHGIREECPENSPSSLIFRPRCDGVRYSTGDARLDARLDAPECPECFAL